MQCPKCRAIDLVDLNLDETLISYHCDQCEGDWLSGERYQAWQSSQTRPGRINTALQLETDFTPSETDNKAALCPDTCRRYLSRVKIPASTPFYLERCPDCNGFWCDRREWDMLVELDLHTCLEYMFTSDWQHKVKEQQHAVSERQALIQKLGETLAAEVFAMGEKLTAAENGDFAVAYLARQVTEQPQETTS